MSVLALFWSYVLWLWIIMYKRLYKWLVTRITGRCELLRLLLGLEQGARRTLSIERCLTDSNQDELRAATRWAGEELTGAELPARIRAIARIKDVKEDVHAQFEQALTRCLLQVLGYQKLLRELDGLRRERFDVTKMEHCALLDELWTLLEPDIPAPGPRHALWETVGFQSDEPGHDFRGMGLLSLHNLIYFGSKYPDACRHLLSLSRHPEAGYSFAIVSINLTDLAFRLMQEGKFKNHFYNLVQTAAPKVEHFHDAYCWIFLRFDKFWREQGPIDVMEFNPVKAKFAAWLDSRLRRPDFVMRPAF